jgi:hypothetical protein
MPRAVGITVENSFVGGLKTESTGLNFPENSCIDTDNCVFDPSGEVYRRNGIEFEADFDLITQSFTNNAIAEYIWKGAAQTGELNFTVVQIGRTIRFFSIGGSGNISGGHKSFTLDMFAFAASGAPEISSVPCSFSSGNGLLFIAHPYCNPVAVEYNSDTDTLTANAITVKIRDMFGVENIISSGSVPSTDSQVAVATITDNVRYNLMNQGWYGGQICTNDNKNFFSSSLIGFYVGYTGVYPSEAEIPWLYKAPLLPITNADGVILSGVPTEAISSLEFAARQKFGNTPAPKGHYILEAFYQDRNSAASAESITGVSVVSSGYHRPGQIAFFAGRVFYGGVAARGFSTKIYFSQILEGSKNLDKCYQRQDPTSEQGGDPLPTDGGWIEIPEMAQVLRMRTYGNELLIVATNGVWMIGGSEGIGFTATDFNVTRLSSIGGLGTQSFVDIDGTPIWWNNDGIYTLSGETGTRPAVKSVSDGIKTFFQDIPAISKEHAKGAYNALTKVVQWVYRSEEEAGISDRYVYDRMLNLDVTTGAFYPWSVTDAENTKIAGIVAFKGRGQTDVEEDVTVGGVPVNVGGIYVTTVIGVSNETTQVFKYVTTTTYDGGVGKMTFSEARNEGLLDWEEATDGETFVSYLIPGYMVRGEAIRKFQSNYLRFWTRNDDPSVFDVQSRWDFSNASTTGRWSNPQRIDMTELNGNYDFRSRRIKFRGHGLALTFKITSVEQEPFNLIGWSALESANKLP